MGNSYEVMVKDTQITLTYRLYKNIEKNSKEFTVDIRIIDNIDDFKKKIYEKVKEINDCFLEIVA
ncbi:13126_t:CDS:1, partial [Funneliformis caledonium]